MKKLILTAFLLLLSGLTQGKYIVVGGGPTGLYMAYSLLRNNNEAEVVVYESREFVRPQVIRVPFKLTKKLPQDMVQTMWPDESTRSQISKPGSINDLNFFPKPDYSYWPFINIGNFQSHMLTLLNSYKNFKYVQNNLSLEDFDLIESNINSKIQGIFIATGAGQFTSNLRAKFSMTEGKARESKGHGIYLVYRNKALEPYTDIKSSELGADGLTYAASNNENKDVQIYTYPTVQGPLKDVYEALEGEIANEFIERAQFTNYLSKPLSLKDNYFGEEKSKGSLWFGKFRKAILELSQKHRIPLPDDLQNVKVIYAERSEYYWKKVSTSLKNNVPLFFIGDASGSTDYKLGLSLGRGLLAVDKLTALISKTPKLALDSFQDYWEGIISSEFEQDQFLGNQFYIRYKYLLAGRKIKANKV